MELLKYSDKIWVINDFLEVDICNSLIHESEMSGFYSTKQKIINKEPGFDSNNRIFFKSDEFAEIIWRKLKNNTPKYHNYSSVGVNEQFRLYKYFEGQTFAKHKDQPFIRNDNERSYFSLLIYFNDNFEGGETTFDEISIKPKAGRLVIFPHDLDHIGSTVKCGHKYIIRSDIMYRKL
jgi:prolyl 4-hydroxylase